MSIAHAKLSASGSSRWLNCPGSVIASEKYPNGSSAFAQEGTSAHALAEVSLTKDTNPDTLIGQDLEGWVVDAEMVEHVEGYISYVKSFNGEHFYEQRVDFSTWVPGGFGTCDCLIIGDGVMHVIDLKYGKGVEVDAENNTQGMLYALGAVSDYGFIYDFETVVIHIYQPRINNFSEWTVSVADLMKFAEYVEQQAKLALTPNAPMIPGDKQCQWCPHKGNCIALMKHTEEVISAEFDDLDNLPVVDDITPEQVGLILTNKKLIESWMVAVEQIAFESMLNGNTVAGFKIVEGRSIRKWRNSDEAQSELEKRLGEDCYTKKLLSPTQAGKALGKNKGDIEHLIVKPEGKPTIAPESDKRKPVGDVSCDFDAIK